jgi:FkbM family methyltransferase
MRASIIEGGKKDSVSLRTSQDSKYAFVMLMFGGDRYTEGCMTLAYSLIRSGTVHDIVCMVTHDVSKDARSELGRLGVKIIEVPYLKYRSKPMLTQRQRNLYTWNNLSYTKWNCLNLTQYKKILFLDADMLVVKNVDHIFEYQTPASQFMDKKVMGKRRNNWGKFVSPRQINKALNNRLFVMDGGLLLIKPNSQHFNEYKKMVKKMEPFGFNSFSAYDEQSLCYFMSVYKNGPQLPWRNLGGEYSCSWTIECDPKSAYILNFIGEIKPWVKDIKKEFPDTIPWYEINDEMKRNTGKIRVLGGSGEEEWRATHLRKINVITSNRDLIGATQFLNNTYDVTYINKYPIFNKACFITITDIIPKAEIPSSYIIICGEHDPSSVPNRATYIRDYKQLSAICKAFDLGEAEVKPGPISMYNVGEHRFTNIPPGRDTFNYDDSFDIWIDDRDTLIREAAKKGIPYEKYMTGCISAFIPPDTTVLDVGTNVGTVSLPLSRLPGVAVVSFEPFPCTYSILFKNIVQNKAFNITPLRMAAGDKNRPNISLSDNVVILPHHTDREGSVTIADLRKEADRIHFGAVHVGKGSTPAHMVTIDELRLNISAMKVDVEGAEPLVFYGARETIKRCMPVIVFEHNENTVSEEMIQTLQLDKEVIDFNIIDYCYSLGYRKFYALDIQDYMLVPPNRKQLVHNSIAKFRKTTYIKGFDNISKFHLFKFVRPRW